MKQAKELNEWDKGKLFSSFARWLTQANDVILNEALTKAMQHITEAEKDCDGEPMKISFFSPLFPEDRFSIDPMVLMQLVQEELERRNDAKREEK